MSAASPLSIWQDKIKRGEITEDPRQIEVMQQLNEIFHQLIEQPRRKGLFSFNKKTAIKGLYLWGTVGTGKTFLIDTFFNALPFQEKLRIHFHAFMQRIHRELKAVSGHNDPLSLVAKKIAKETRVLCFDEFFVSDMADAMLLAGFLNALFKEGVTLITNSNCKPDDLYKKGMLRERFLPAIELIKQHTHVLQMLTTNDYRLRHMLEAGVYYTPLGAPAEFEMEQSFKFYADTTDYSTAAITVLGREIEIRKATKTTIWFDFNCICGIPRCQNDYIELAKIYTTVLISNIPIIGEREEALITSFIKLVDVFYDERIRLILSAQTQPRDIYPNGPMSFEFQRTESRLIEMQSKDYFDDSLHDESL